MCRTVFALLLLVGMTTSVTFPGMCRAADAPAAQHRQLVVVVYPFFGVFPRAQAEKVETLLERPLVDKNGSSQAFRHIAQAGRTPRKER